MIKEGKIGVQEAVCLATITMSTKIFFSSPAFLTRFVGNTGWYMTLISNATAALAFTFIYLLLKRFPGKNIVDIFDISMGRIVGFIFSFMFTATFLQGAGVYSREFIEVLRIFVFPDSPTGFMIGALVVAVTVAAFLGLENIARISKLFGYIMLFAFIMLLILASQNFKYTNLFPILGFGLGPTLVHGLLRSSAYEEVTVLTVFAGSLQGIRYIKKAGYISLILSGIIISAGLLCFTLIFPYTVNQELAAPMYIFARTIRYGAFIQRLDPLFLFLWNTATFITISVLFYSSVSTYCKMFRLQDTRPVIIPMAVLLFALAMTPKDFPSIVYGYVERIREYGWAIFYVLPLVALIIAVLRKKKGEKSNA